MNSKSKRTVVLLATTPYQLLRRTVDYVVLRSGRDRELWRLVETPRKGYAIRIDGLEYEFESVVPE